MPRRCRIASWGEVTIWHQVDAESGEGPKPGENQMIMLALLLAGAHNGGSPPLGAPFATGPGIASCAAAWSRDHAPSSFFWTQGLWSGLNVAKAATIGSGRDSAEIVAEVKKTCANDPAQPLLKAVVETYAAMSGR